jgi:beta-lactamase class A
MPVPNNMINRRTFLQQIMVGGATVLHVATTPRNTLASGSSAPLVPPPWPVPLQLVSRHGMPATDLARRWARDDAARAAGSDTQPWMWGNEVVRAGYEAYANAPDGRRMVWYFAKGRLEATQPDGNPQDARYISSGALVRELVSGTINTGDRAAQRYVPALVPIVGDNVRASQTITYADLRQHMLLGQKRRSPARSGAVVVETLNEYGSIVPLERFARYNVALARYDDAAGHNIAQLFDDALGAERIAELAGAPLSEPLWVTVPVNNTPTDVLIQLWERRVLLYTPSLPPHERVQWNDVGQHYLRWRYGALPHDTFDPRSVLDPLAAQPLRDLAPRSEEVTNKRAQTVGVAVFNLRSGTLHQHEGQRSFPMYSTVKLPIMVALLDQAMRDGREVTPNEDALIRVMIQKSDNDATDVLLRQIGGAATVNTYLKNIGLLATKILNGIWGASTTTPQDMAALLGKLAIGTILNLRMRTYALDVLRGVVPEQRWGVGDGVADGTVALKNGWYPAAKGWGINSIGIVSDGPTLYVLAMYSAANATMDAGINRLNTLARHVRDAVG